MRAKERTKDRKRKSGRKRVLGEKREVTISRAERRKDGKKKRITDMHSRIAASKETRLALCKITPFAFVGFAASGLPMRDAFSF